MLAKKYDEVATATFNKKHWASRKLDGVRCMTRIEDGILKTSSRGGGDYDIPATYILQDPVLQEFFKEYSDIILDGELYIHGKPLPYISGICRKITLEESHKELKYYIYDLCVTSDPDLIFKDRLDLLNDFRDKLEKSNNIIVCEHVETNS